MWIRFEEEDRYTPAPNFCLPSNRAEKVCISDFHGDCNLVLFFSHEAGCPTCLDILNGFAERRREYMGENAQVLGIFPGASEQLQTEVSENPEFKDLPLIWMADHQGLACASYSRLMDESLVSEQDAMLFILDNYGAPYAALVGKELEDGDIHHDILKWLQFINMQCPE